MMRSPDRSKGSEVRVLLIGEEHIRSKVSRHYRLLERTSGIRTYYFIDDRSGLTRKNEDLPSRRVMYAPRPPTSIIGLFSYWLNYVSAFFRIRPHLLEVYSSIHPIVLLPMVYLGCLMRVPRIVVSRGELYPGELYSSDLNQTIYKLFFSRILRLASLIVYKERYIAATLDKLAPRVSRIHWYNSIPISSPPDYERDENMILFLNSFKKWRNIELVVNAAALVREKIADVRFELVGAINHLAGESGVLRHLVEHERNIMKMIDSLDLGEIVKIVPFSSTPKQYYGRAKVFVLPADLVFCNYSLLEAMERGVPPIVSDQRDEGARLIVQDGVNGLIVPLNEFQLAEAIVNLLDDEEYRRELAGEARHTVEERFNIERSIGQLVQAYLELLPTRTPG